MTNTGKLYMMRVQHSRRALNAGGKENEKLQSNKSDLRLKAGNGSFKRIKRLLCPYRRLERYKKWQINGKKRGTFTAERNQFLQV